MDALTTHNLTVGYPAAKGKTPACVLSDLNLRLPEETVTVLIGANGIGKSTLLRTLAGTQRQLSGSIEMTGTNIDDMSVLDRAKKLALVYTDRTGGGGLTVSELVSLGRQPYTGFLGRLSKNDREICRDAMEAVGILHKADSYMARLSDGERQKAMIARALAQQTPIIMLDEPTSFLDVASRLEIMQLLGRLAKDEKKTVLLSTHDIAPAMSVADRLWIAPGNGQTIIEGRRERLIADGVMDKVFPGRQITYDTCANDFRFKTPKN